MWSIIIIIITHSIHVTTTLAAAVRCSFIDFATIAVIICCCGGSDLFNWT